MKRIVRAIGIGFYALSFAGAQAGAPQNAPTANMLTVTKSQHVRIALPADILRIAVGDPDMLSAEPIGTRELILLGKSSGRTSMIVWFRNGAVQDYLVTVQRDVSLLQSALQRIYSDINVEIAPDRDAIILTGTVPDLSYSLRAEALAQDYLNAGPRVLLPAAAAPAPATAPAGPAAGQQPSAAPTQPPAPEPNPPQGQAPVQAPPSPAAPTVNVAVQTQPPQAPTPQPSGTVINLLQLENLPPTPEEKIRQAIQGISGANVTIRRILKGFIRNDTVDAFVLEGSVPNQVTLVRILSLASQILTGQVAIGQDIHVVADEAGALAGVQGAAGQIGALGGLGGVGSILGGGGAANLQNQVQKNIARAKVIEMAAGRLISFLQVTDLPQVRVGIRIYEVSRNRLRTFSPDLATIVSTFNQPGLLVAPAGPAKQLGARTTIDTGTKTALQNVLAFLGGSFANEFQLTSGHFAMDAVLSYLERVGIAKSLSTPSLTVLSGEQATFQVGGEVPVQEAFVPFGTAAATPGGIPSGNLISTFISTTFVAFGVQLSIRPLVGDDNTVTLDIQPRVVQPNTDLTATIRGATGTNPATTAFNTRALRTSARLQDGQAILIAGLLTSDMNNTQASTPGFRSVPGLGWLFRDYQKVDDSTDLVLVINPAVLRDPIPNVQLWEQPDLNELLEGFGSSSLGRPQNPTASGATSVSHVQ